MPTIQFPFHNEIAYDNSIQNGELLMQVNLIEELELQLVTQS
jgi:hypothetical protein